MNGRNQHRFRGKRTFDEISDSSLTHEDSRRKHRRLDTPTALAQIKRWDLLESMVPDYARNQSGGYNDYLIDAIRLLFAFEQFERP